MAPPTAAPTPAAAEAKEALTTRILKGLNSLTHMRGMYEISWVVYWCWQLLIGPIWAVLLLEWWVLEGLAGKWWPRYNKPQPGQAILITGCDTGFGHEAAQRFAAAGWTVYAGCLTDAGMAALAEKGKACSGKLVPLQMDVTKPADVDRVVQRLVADGVSLYALINNAGIGRGVPFDWAPMEEYRQIMEVNCFAVIGVTKACLPLLKQSKGRIINVSSIAGLAAAPLMSAYAASKHAVEAFSTCIRVELQPFGIRVVTLNPSFHKTPIATNALPYLEKVYKALPPHEREAYGDEYFHAAADLTKSFTDGCWEPVHVVNKIVQATTLVDPMNQYLIGMDGRFELAPFVNNTPINFQLWAVMNTYCRKLIPAAARKGFKPSNGAPLLPTTNGNGSGSK